MIPADELTEDRAGHDTPGGPAGGGISSWINAAGDLRSRHAALSAAQVHFLDFAAREPDCLLPASFAAFEAPEAYEEMPPLQPWPLFLGRAKRAEIERASVEVCSLIKELPQRVFGNDPNRLAEYFNLVPDTALLISSVIRQEKGMAHAVARGDFVETTAGFKCCEFNIAGNLGGWEAAACAEKLLSVPVLRRFLDEHGIAATVTDVVREMFLHIVDDALGRSLASDGRLDMAILFEPGKVPSDSWQRYFDRELRWALAERGAGLSGSVSVCLGEALTSAGGRLCLGDRRIHLVIDTNDGAPVGRPLFLALMGNQVRLYNGPASRVLSDKLNLALLSEMQDSELFSAEERAAIRAHVPWSRRVAEDFVDYGGERAYLPDLLAAERDRLVLKLGMSMKGSHVHSGRFTPPSQWEELVRTALAERTWVVQERLDPVPYLFLIPDRGPALHDVVWGLFVFGGRFGGGFLRVIPSGRTGVINVGRGAVFASFLEVAE